MEGGRGPSGRRRKNRRIDDVRERMRRPAENKRGDVAGLRTRHVRVARAAPNSTGHVPLARMSIKRLVGRVHPIAARGTRGRRCCIAPLLDYFESHDLRCSSKKARTCSGNSAPKNSTPAGSGSGLKTLSGVGIFGGLASMVSLLYKPIICLGPRFAPVSDATEMFFVALTAHGGNATWYLNKIFRLIR
jgi:hypothetical protein